ncbi:MAG: hypothetical protein IJ336_02815 [Lachnospiraceae bacterium]|nr:hypothetical protein [Lachnospiraceae bacterium]
MQDININLSEINSVYNSIKELYINYCDEVNQEKKNLEILERDIKEIKDYISYLNEHQKSDAFVFSPRGVISKNSGTGQDSIYDTGKVIDFSEVQKKKDELACLEENKRISEEKINKLDSTIAILETNKNILKQVEVFKNSFDEDKRSIEDHNNNIRKELEEKQAEFINDIKGITEDKLFYISHMIDMIESFIDHYPMRAKLELKKMKDNVKSVSESLGQIVKVPEGDIGGHARRDS